MTTVIIYGIIAVAVAIVIVAVLVTVLPDDHLSHPERDVVPTGLPAGRQIGADDLARVRLPVAARGYRMVDTDAVLDRLTSELERRDHEIAALRLAMAAPPATSASGTAAAPAADPAAVPAIPADDAYAGEFEPTHPQQPTETLPTDQAPPSERQPDA